MIHTSSLSTLILFYSLLLSDVNALKYSSGSTEVEVTTTLVDANNSTEKCVTFMKNAPEKYNTACFTTLFTDGGTFMGCKIKLGEDFCDSCQACENNDEEVGFVINCDSIEPQESTYTSDPSCVVLNDANIQEVLVDDDFADTAFTFEMSKSVTDDSDMTNETNTKADESGSTSVLHNNMLFQTVSSLAAVVLMVIGM